jgi:hypothetical protein
MKRFLIGSLIFAAILAMAALYCLHRGINDGVQITIPDADGPLPHQSTMTCRYRFFDGIHLRPPVPSPPVAPNLPSLGECPWFAD